VLSHARALLTSSPEGHCDYIDANLRRSFPRRPQAVRPAHSARGYLRSREHGMVMVPLFHVQVVISPLVLCSQAASIRSADGFQ
jgi:S-adenosyl methyltransferase